MAGFTGRGWRARRCVVQNLNARRGKAARQPGCEAAVIMQ